MHKLVRDIFENCDESDVQDFLEIQCGFTEEEALSWIREAKELLGAGEDN